MAFLPQRRVAAAGLKDILKLTRENPLVVVLETRVPLARWMVQQRANRKLSSLEGRRGLLSSTGQTFSSLSVCVTLCRWACYTPLLKKFTLSLIPLSLSRSDLKQFQDEEKDVVTWTHELLDNDDTHTRTSLSFFAHSRP